MSLGHLTDYFLVFMKDESFQKQISFNLSGHLDVDVYCYC